MTEWCKQCKESVVRFKNLCEKCIFDKHKITPHYLRKKRSKSTPTRGDGWYQKEYGYGKSSTGSNVKSA